MLSICPNLPCMEGPFVIVKGFQKNLICNMSIRFYNIYFGAEIVNMFLVRDRDTKIEQKHM